MKSVFLKITALCLICACLLSGCLPIELDRLLGLSDPEIAAFSDMEYTRPDPTAVGDKSQEVLLAVEQGQDAEAVMEKVLAFYEAYHSFYTAYALSNIYYCKDLRDTYWEKEYNYCLEKASQVDAALDTLLYALADCELREELEHEDYFGPDFFDDYEGESLWDETFTALMEEEARLQSQYYTLTEQANAMDYYSDAFFTTVGAEMGELFVELVQVRQEMAEHAGYDDYLSFAYEFYYYRDFTPEQTVSYLQEIARELTPLYKNADTAAYWEIAGNYSTERMTLNYVGDCAKAMGGKVEEAFQVMKDKGLYDISISENKYSSSFEVYLSNYNAPYIFMDPSGAVSDQLSFTHEFGHFCNDYASWGSVVGIDVAEIFSQGLEYLSLCYGGTEDMTWLKMTDCLNLCVEQSCYASFEHQVYGLSGEALTLENVYALYEQVGKDYGFDSWNWDSRDFVLIPHFYTSPLYIISYVISNDAALQLYQLEQKNQGTGLELYEENLDTEQTHFLAFVESAGLESPFLPGRVEAVRKTLEEALD